MMSPATIRVPTDPLRSRIMRAVRRRGTSPEIEVRSALSRLGFRFRENVTGLPGSPDLANKRRKIAIFVHGCFWHRHASCSRASTPTRNFDFWNEKFVTNVRRDRRKARELRRLGYRVLVVWECDTRDPVKLERKLARMLAR